MPASEATMVNLLCSVTTIQGLGVDNTTRAGHNTIGIWPGLSAVMPDNIQRHVSWTETSPANRFTAIVSSTR